MEAWLPVGAPLKQAFSTMLQHDAGWIAVLDGDRFLGVLTPARLHEALRRSIDADAARKSPAGTWSWRRSRAADDRERLTIEGSPRSGAAEKPIESGE